MALAGVPTVRCVSLDFLSVRDPDECSFLNSKTRLPPDVNSALFVKNLSYKITGEVCSLESSLHEYLSNVHVKNNRTVS
jgi:hypothetical protein